MKATSFRITSMLSEIFYHKGAGWDPIMYTPQGTDPVSSTCTYTHIYTCVHAHICLYIYTYSCVCIYICTHTHTPTSIHSTQCLTLHIKCRPSPGTSATWPGHGGHHRPLGREPQLPEPVLGQSGGGARGDGVALYRSPERLYMAAGFWCAYYELPSK